MDANGSNESAIDLGCVDPCAGDTAPTWLPGGNRIAFTPVVGPFDGPGGSARSAVLYSAKTDGSGIRRLSEPGIDGSFEDYFARFSPDGSYIIFTRVRNHPYNSAVYRMDRDGSHVQRLTPWRIDADLAVLSQATHGRTKDLIAFETYGHGAPKGENPEPEDGPWDLPIVDVMREAHAEADPHPERPGRGVQSVLVS